MKLRLPDQEDWVDHKLAVRGPVNPARVDLLRAARHKLGSEVQDQVVPVQVVAVRAVREVPIVAVRHKVDQRVDHRVDHRAPTRPALSTMCLNSMPTAME